MKNLTHLSSVCNKALVPLLAKGATRQRRKSVVRELEDGEYQIGFSNSDKVLEAQNGRIRKLIQNEANETDNQIFILKKQSCGHYTVQCKSRGAYLCNTMTNVFCLITYPATDGYIKCVIRPSNDQHTRLAAMENSKVELTHVDSIRNSNDIFHCKRLIKVMISNDKYIMAPPLHGMAIDTTFIPYAPILKSRAPIPCKNKAFKSVESVGDWINNLQIGDIVDACDDQGKWYESIIRWFELKGNRKLLYLHYIGWNKKWDEMIYSDDVKRIAKRNAKTKGPFRNRRVHCRCRAQHPRKYQYPLSYCNNWAPKK